MDTESLNDDLNHKYRIISTLPSKYVDIILQQIEIQKKNLMDPNEKHLLEKLSGLNFLIRIEHKKQEQQNQDNENTLVLVQIQIIYEFQLNSPEIEIFDQRQSNTQGLSKLEMQFEIKTEYLQQQGIEQKSYQILKNGSTYYRITALGNQQQQKNKLTTDLCKNCSIQQVVFYEQNKDGKINRLICLICLQREFDFKPINYILINNVKITRQEYEQYLQNKEIQFKENNSKIEYDSQDHDPNQLQLKRCFCYVFAKKKD